MSTLSLRLRLVGMVAVLGMFFFVWLSIWLPNHQSLRLRETLDIRGDELAMTFSRLLGPALGDGAAASEHLALLDHVPDVAWAGLWDPDGALVALFGPAPERVPPGDGAADELWFERTIPSPSGNGLLVIAMSSRGIAAARRSDRQTVAGVCALVLSLALLGAWTIGDRALAPMRQLALAARRVADGEVEVGSLALDIARRGNEVEEVRMLTLALSDMALQLRRRMSEIERERTKAREAEGIATTASQAKSVFLANMSHELRTPLNAVIGYSEMLYELAEDAGHGDYTADLLRIRQAGAHLLGVINDILDLAKIEAGRMEMSFEKTDPGLLVEEVAKSVASAVASGGNELVVEVASDVGLVRTDPIRLRQVLLKLLGNATKFTDHGRIWLRLARRGSQILFEVQDTGIGVPMDQIERLFLPFTQADASTTKRYGGTGLGLTLAQRFAVMLGGAIEVDSRPGEGSTFRLTLEDSGPVGLADFNSSWDPLPPRIRREGARAG